MLSIRSLFDRKPEASPSSPWEARLFYQNANFIRNGNTPNGYIGSQLVITPEADDKIRIASVATFATPVTVLGAFGRGASAYPMCKTEPEYFHDAPISKVAALTWLDNHFTGSDFATEGQRASYYEWKRRLPESELQGYKLTPRPEPVSPAVS